MEVLFDKYFLPQVIDTIAHAIAGVDGVALLDIDPGLSTNRTIYSRTFTNSCVLKKNSGSFEAFVGDPQAVMEGALAAARSAYNLIDMTRHSGEHPRIGALVNETYSSDYS